MASRQDVPKRPRLSLQIKTSCSPATRSSRSYVVDPRDPTAFNTLSNVYVTAIERSIPVQAEPLTAINTSQSFPPLTPSEYQPKDLKTRVVTPYIASYPETPLSATASSPQPMEINFPSVMTATPPLSAGPVESNGSKIFNFSADDISGKAPISTCSPSTRSEPKSANRPMRSLVSIGLHPPPYTHPQSLHSILRNSPLPPATAIQLRSPRRQSLRLQEKAAKRVGYNNPLTQEIVNNMYTKSHIDLLAEELSPLSPLSPRSPRSPSLAVKPQVSIDLAMAFSPNEIQDGGQTPGPLEDMRRRMNTLSSGVPTSPGNSPGGIRKRRRKEKKRRWVWTIGQDDEDDDEAGGSILALRTEEGLATKEVPPQVPVTVVPVIKAPKLRKPRLRETTLTLTPSIEESSTGSESEGQDIYLSDTSSCVSHTENRSLTPNEMEMDMSTPTVSHQK